MVNNPALGIPGAPAGIPPLINNPGLPISQRVEKNLKLLTYFLRFQAHVSRTVLVVNITLVMVQGLKQHHTWEKSHEDLEAPMINSKDWSKMMEAIQGWFHGCLGQTKIPLAYVICRMIVVMVEADNPTTNYTS